MPQGIKVASLFDGISCGRAALDRAGIAVSAYEAYEIDKYAKAISRQNYPGIAQRGDVTNADFSLFRGHDLVLGGSPCNFWSISKANREADKAGMGWKLFMKFAEAVRIINPRFFLYENVASMPAGIKACISEELGVGPVLINSALVSAQSRKRLYWTNIKGVAQPEDRGILIKDILSPSPAIQAGAALRTRSGCSGSCKRLEIRGDGKLNALTTAPTDSAVCSPVRVGQFAGGGQGIQRLRQKRFLNGKRRGQGRQGGDVQNRPA